MDLVFRFAGPHLGAGERRAVRRGHARGDRARSAREGGLSRRGRRWLSSCAVEDLRPATARRSCCPTVSLHAGRGPVARAARPQRHGQDHAGQLARRRHALSRRHASGSAARDITRAARRTSARMPGVGWVPQERNIFKSLTVEENLTAVARPGPVDAPRVYDMFPRLAERRAQSRQPAVRRRAADAGDRPRADPQSAHHAARRAARGARADHRRGTAGALAAHHPRRGHVGDRGRAERAEDPRRHRPRRHPRARRHRARGRQRNARRPTAMLEKYLGVTQSERACADAKTSP